MELLIVFVILGILGTIMALRVRGMTRNAQLATMQSDLRSLVVAQELYYQSAMEYADLDALDAFRSSEGVVIAVDWVARDGFAATATHDAANAAGLVCGVFRGPAPSDAAGPAVEEGLITCQ